MQKVTRPNAALWYQKPHTVLVTMSVRASLPWAVERVMSEESHFSPPVPFCLCGWYLPQESLPPLSAPHITVICLPVTPFPRGRSDLSPRKNIPVVHVSQPIRRRTRPGVTAADCCDPERVTSDLRLRHLHNTNTPLADAVQGPLRGVAEVVLLCRVPEWMSRKLHPRFPSWKANARASEVRRPGTLAVSCCLFGLTPSLFWK